VFAALFVLRHVSVFRMYRVNIANICQCSCVFDTVHFEFHFSFWVWLNLTGCGLDSDEISSNTLAHESWSAIVVSVPADFTTAFARAFGKLLALKIVWPRNVNSYQWIIIPRIIICVSTSDYYSLATLFQVALMQLCFCWWTLRVSLFVLGLTGFDWTGAEASSIVLVILNLVSVFSTVGIERGLILIKYRQMRMQTNLGMPFTPQYQRS